MSFNSFIPSDILKPFVKKYMIIESDDSMTNRILPDTSLAVAFRYQGQVGQVANNETEKLPAMAISGLRKSVRLISYAKGTATFVVLFKETGAKAFFRQPMHELFEQSVSLDNIIRREKIADIEEKLAASKDNTERVAVVEQFLLSILYDPEKDNLVMAAVGQIRKSEGNIRIRELADSLYVSHDAFEKRFRKTVGTTPKQFSSIVRMKAVIQNMHQKQSLTDIAYDAGFFDQAHFNKEFKLFTGQAPTEFFKSPLFW